MPGSRSQQQRHGCGTSLASVLHTWQLRAAICSRLPVGGVISQAGITAVSCTLQHPARLPQAIMQQWHECQIHSRSCS